MVFTSPDYYIFLFLTAVVYFQLPKRFRTYVLLFASYFFYSTYDARFLFFILTTTIVSYTAAVFIENSQNRRLQIVALSTALAVELLLLGTTKYFNPVAAATGWMAPLNILVPLGISFYTFQTIGYLSDVFRKALPAEKNFLRYALFLSFFPHLLAGPIEPAQKFLPQLKHHAGFNRNVALMGGLLILLGLCKKLVIADHLALIVNLVFDEPNLYKGSAVATALFLARYQIYCDFSGYTDIALGSAHILGFQLTSNFNRPFSAVSITDYWRRWHISLGQWIRHYIFYPLVSTSFSRLGVHALILLTFLVLGLWHGGTVNFLIYGLWHGFFVIADSKTRTLRQKTYTLCGLTKHPAFLQLLATLGTFLLIVVPPTLFFRSTSLEHSRILILNLFATGWTFSDLGFISESLVLSKSLYIGLGAIFILEIGQWLFEKKQLEPTGWSINKICTCAIFLLLTILVFGQFTSNAKFIYTNF